MWDFLTKFTLNGCVLARVYVVLDKFAMPHLSVTGKDVTVLTQKLVEAWRRASRRMSMAAHASRREAGAAALGATRLTSTSTGLGWLSALVQALSARFSVHDNCATGASYTGARKIKSGIKHRTRISRSRFGDHDHYATGAAYCICRCNSAVW